MPGGRSRGSRVGLCYNANVFECNFTNNINLIITVCTLAFTLVGLNPVYPLEKEEGDLISLISHLANIFAFMFSIVARLKPDNKCGRNSLGIFVSAVYLINLCFLFMYLIKLPNAQMGSFKLTMYIIDFTIYMVTTIIIISLNLSRIVIDCTGTEYVEIVI